MISPENFANSPLSSPFFLHRSCDRTNSRLGRHQGPDQLLRGAPEERSVRGRFQSEGESVLLEIVLCFDLETGSYHPSSSQLPIKLLYTMC